VNWIEAGYRRLMTFFAASKTSSTLISRKHRISNGQGNILPSKGVKHGDQGKRL
jgi:hypothetical protein